MKRDDLTRQLMFHRVATLILLAAVILQFYVGVCR